MIRTDSACPVLPVLTVSYSAVLAEPPEYPAVTPVTPFTCSNTAWMPQKQPPASTTVAELLALVTGSSVAGLGIFTAALEALQATVLPRQSIAKLRMMKRNIQISNQADFTKRKEAEFMQ